jgi:hypothetical protein
VVAFLGRTKATVSSPIFISHSSIDQTVAETICNALESRGCPCWISSRDIGPGQNFQESIVKAIRSAKVMLLVFTSNANNSNEIKKELVLASRYHVTVVPVRVEDVIPNDAFAYEFATRQWVDLFKDWEGEIERLILQIRRIIAETAPIRESGLATAEKSVPQVPFPAGVKTSPLRLLVLLSALAAVALGIGGAYVYTRPTAPSALPAPPRESHPTAPQANILKEEPPIGQLPTGAKVLVDDGTCPPRQIKQLIGGNVATGQARIRSCVPR